MIIIVSVELSVDLFYHLLLCDKISEAFTSTGSTVLSEGCGNTALSSETWESHIVCELVLYHLEIWEAQSSKVFTDVIEAILTSLEIHRRLS